MLSKEGREKREIIVRNPHHLFKRFHERGSRLFGNNISPEDMFLECINAINNPSKSVIVEDARGKESTHHCMFISDSGGYVCLPCRIDEANITLITITDIKEADKPVWFVRNYNDMAFTRNILLMRFPFG